MAPSSSTTTSSFKLKLNNFVFAIACSMVLLLLGVCEASSGSSTSTTTATTDRTCFLDLECGPHSRCYSRKCICDLGFRKVDMANGYGYRCERIQCSSDDDCARVHPETTCDTESSNTCLCTKDMDPDSQTCGSNMPMSWTAILAWTLVGIVVILVLAVCACLGICAGLGFCCVKAAKAGGGLEAGAGGVTVISATQPTPSSPPAYV